MSHSDDPPSLLEEIAAYTIQHHGNNSEAVKVATAKLVDEIKQKPAEMENVDVASIIQFIKTKDLIDVTSKLLKQFEEKGKNDRLKKVIDGYFEKCLFVSKQDAANQLIDKVEKSSVTIQHILYQIIDDAAAEIKSLQGSLDGASKSITGFCERNYKTIKLSVPLLLSKCFDLFNKKGKEFLSFVTKEILSNFEVISNDPNLKNDIYDIELPKNLWNKTYLVVTHPSIKNCESSSDLLLYNEISKDAEITTKKTINLFNTNFLNEISIILFEFCLKHLKQFLRVGIMKLICLVYIMVTNVKDSNAIVRLILSSFHIFVKYFVTSNEIKQKLLDERAPQYLWERCSLIILQQDPLKHFTVMDLLIHITRPDSPKRNQFILESINGLNEIEKLKWEKALTKAKEGVGNNENENSMFDLTVIFNCEKLPIIAFHDVRSYVMTRLSLLTSTKSDADFLLQILVNYGTLRGSTEIIFGEVSNDLWINALKKCIELLSKLKISDWKKYSSGFDLLFQISQAESENRGLAIDEIVRSTLNDLKTFFIGFQCIQDFNLENLENEIVNIGYYVKKFEALLNSRHKKIFSDITRGKIVFEESNEITGENESLTEFLSIWKKYCIRLYVKSKKALNDFSNNYLKKYIGDIGMGCKKNKYKRLSLLTLATKEWSCIIDIQILIKQISPELWKVFFKQLFCQQVEVVGCSENYDLLSKTFPYLQRLFQKETCFFDGLFVPGSSLAAHAKAIIGIDLESDWSQRPLTDKQKEYASMDALIPLLLKEELQKRLNMIERKRITEFSIEYETTRHVLQDQVSCLGTSYADNPEILFFVIHCLKYYYGDIGINSDRNKNYRITLLQLATSNWLCVTDVQKLLNEVSEEKWTVFFNELFGNNIIGFSFRNDRSYFCNTFPYLQEWFQSKKVLCIQETTAKIIKEQQKDDNKSFDNSFQLGYGSAAHTKAILNMDLNENGRIYKTFYIDNPKILFEFFLNYHLKYYHGYIRINAKIDKDQKITLLLLATSKWLFIIDVQKLSDQISPENWTIFFNQLCEKKLVGSSFRKDRDYLCKTFPYLHDFFQSASVLCIQKAFYHGKTYECFYIDNAEIFYDIFLNCCLNHHRGYIVFDAEADKEKRVSIIQLAISKWLFIIDVQKLFNQISQPQWRRFFKKLFRNKLVGFSFKNDRIFLCNTFPNLQGLFRKAKVLCIQKAAEKIFKEFQTDDNKIFDDSFKPGSSMKDHAKAILNIHVNKDQQKSDWGQRHLTEEQLDYAYKDALYPFLIAEELRNRLNMTENEFFWRFAE